MRILIVSGIFSPEAGGPATYASQLAAKLSERGHQVSVLAFSDRKQYEGDEHLPFRLARIVRGNKLWNRLRMFGAVLRRARRSDLIYTLDWFAAGLPAALAAKLRDVPYVVRVGGDYLWEQRYLESGETPMPLADFYEQGFHRRLSYRPFFLVIRWVLSHATRVIFNSDKQRALYEKEYGLSRTSVIHNAVPRGEMAHIARGASTKELVFWGRFIVMKNLDTLLRAFAQARLPDGYTLTLIGDGPRKEELVALAQDLGLTGRVTFLSSMPLRDVLERVKNCRAFILPSWTDISPNQVYEALSIALPALVTSENYLPIKDRLPAEIDPRSVQDIARKLEMIADDASYADFSTRWNSIAFTHSWDDVLEEHLAIFSTI